MTEACCTFLSTKQNAFVNTLFATGLSRLTARQTDKQMDRAKTVYSQPLDLSI